MSKQKNITTSELQTETTIPLEAEVGKPFYDDGQIKIYNGNFESVLPQLTEKIDCIITDPPYPDYYVDEYKYYEGILNFLADYDCRQMIFWSVRAEFPLDYTAIHIWDKYPAGENSGVQGYERIFERNGNENYKLFRAFVISNKLRAMRSADIFTGHRSQKPIFLMKKLVKYATDENKLILDPFMGTGSTLAAAKKLGRRAIGIEINEKWCEVAAKRLEQFELF